MQEVLGIDIGGVIIDRANDNTDTSFFSDNYLRTTQSPNAFGVIRALVEHRFQDRVFVVSKCGPKVQAKSLRWLDHHRFYDLTRVPRDNIHFCLERHEKAGICKRLQITHFIDDKLEVLGYLDGIVPYRYLFNPQEREVRKFPQHLPRVRRVRSWDEILADLVPLKR